MNARPRLRPDVVVRKIPSREETYVVVKDPVNQKYYRYDEWEYDMLLLLDGTRDLDQVTAEFRVKHPAMDVDLQAVVDYVESLNQSGLIERTEAEQHLAMLDQMRSFRKKRFYDAEKSTLFQILIPLFDPDELMNRTIRWIRWWWSPWFVLPWLGIFALVLGFLVGHWDIYWARFWGLVDVRHNTIFDWMILIVMMFATGMWHELGHGFTCKRYGGEVHSIGIMIFYMQPAFYCGIDDSYLFPNRAHRMYVAFGGSYFELMLCSLALPVWILTPAEWTIHQLSLIVVLLSGLSLVLFNLNPLIKLDGYYVLMDLLDVPNLREDSFEYIGNLFKRAILHLKVIATPLSRRRRRIYLVYGVCSILYTATILLILYEWLRGRLVGWLGPIGYVALAAGVLFYTRRQVRDAMRFLRHLWLDKKDLLLSRRGGAAAGGAILLLALLAAVPRTSTRVEAAFVVEPVERAVIRAPAEGFVRKVSVSEGSAVDRSTVLAVMEDPELTAARGKAAADLDLARRMSDRARGDGAPAARREHAAEEAEARTRVAILRDREAQLTLVSPIQGVVSTPYLEDARGRHLAEGATFCTIDRLDTVRLAVAASEIDVEEIADGTPTRAYLAAYPGRTLRSRVRSLALIADAPSGGREIKDVVRSSRMIRILVETGNDDGLFRPGMTGRIQFLTRPRSFAGKLWRELNRWVESIVW